MSLFVRRTLVVHLVIMTMALIVHGFLKWELEEPVGRLLIKGMVRPWYGATSSVTETISSQKNGLNSKHGSQNYPASKSVNADPRLQIKQNISDRSSSGLSSSWKNFEEEEFMWEMHFRLSKQDAVNISNNSRKDCWAFDVSKNGFRKTAFQSTKYS